MRTRTLLFVPVAVLLTGCVKAPDVQLARVELMGVGFSGATIMTELRIVNPNPFRIEADSISLQLDGSQQANNTTWSNITKETHAEQYILAKKSITTLKLPIDFPYAGLALPIRSLLTQGTFNYRLSGVVYVRKPLPRSVPFTRQGTLAIGGNR